MGVMIAPFPLCAESDAQAILKVTRRYGPGTNVGFVFALVVPFASSF
jgi:hypothetical protein